jgi:hypothetical protein
MCGLDAFINPAFYDRHYPGSWDQTPAERKEAQRRWDRWDNTGTTSAEEKTMTTTNGTVKLPGNGIPTPDPDEVRKSQIAYLSQSPTTTPAYENNLPTGAVPSLQPNPGMLRALLQPILFFTLTEPVDAYKAGDTVALQFWGEGRVMMTPLPAEAARGRIPTTQPANKLRGYIAVPRHA